MVVVKKLLKSTIFLMAFNFIILKIRGIGLLLNFYVPLLYDCHCLKYSKKQVQIRIQGILGPHKQT